MSKQVLVYETVPNSASVFIDKVPLEQLCADLWDYLGNAKKVTRIARKLMRGKTIREVDFFLYRLEM